jgi:hypothetical protein
MHSCLLRNCWLTHTQAFLASRRHELSCRSTLTILDTPDNTERLNRHRAVCMWLLLFFFNLG